jgi:hypothetical protein
MVDAWTAKYFLQKMMTTIRYDYVVNVSSTRINYIRRKRKRLGGLVPWQEWFPPHAHKLHEAKEEAYGGTGAMAGTVSSPSKITR